MLKAFLAKINIFLRSSIFSFGMIISVLIFSLIILVCFFLPFSRRYRISQFWSGFSLWWLKVTCGINYQVNGLENIPNQAVIVMAKHQSTWETLFFNWYFPPLAWVVKKELLWIPFFGWALSLLKPIAINRAYGSTAVRQVISRGTNYLSNGRWVLIFPEGTRTKPGTRKKYGLGGTVLAIHSGFPILPVALNAGEFWPRRSYIKKPGTIKIVFGPLIESIGRSPHELNCEIEEWIENTMNKL